MCFRQSLVGDLLGGALHGLALLLAVRVDERVSQDSEHPRLQIGPSLERVERSVRLHHGLLHQILSILAILAQVVCVAVELRMH